MPTEQDEVQGALEAVIRALQDNIEGSRRAIANAERIVGLRREGRAYQEILDAEERPLVVEQITENLDRLSQHGARLRRAEAAELYASGLTMEQIAEMFGVTRQRVSAVLSAAEPPHPTGRGRPVAPSG
jgi:DNA-directed RNA polymerase sigma subunit (sigma70/sigma32)